MINTVILILSTIIITLIAQDLIRKKWKEFFNRTTLIKKYWKFVISFSVIAVMSGSIIYLYTENITNNLMLLVQALTLIFAIFVGYFAFQQVSEARLDKLIEQGLENFQEGHYLRAIHSYEEAFRISPKNFSVLSNLQECYLLNKDDKSFNEKDKILEEILIEDGEKIIYYYLRSAKYILREDLGNAKKRIKECVNFINNSEISFPIRWSFQELRKSKLYENLQGESKSIMDNFINYLQGVLNADLKDAFEEGNYKLEETKIKTDTV